VFLFKFWGGGGAGKEEDFVHFSFVPIGSQCVPHGCSQSHLALIPYVLLKVLPFSYISVGQRGGIPSIHRIFNFCELS
jgi:hypothetical protein